MTIVIALNDDKNDCIWFGCDTQGTLEDMDMSFGEKIFSLEVPVINCDEGDDEFITLNIGVSGSHFLMSYLTHSFQPPSIDTRWDFISYLYNKFFQKLQEELSLHKLLKNENEVIDSESSMIIIYENEIYEVYQDFSIFHEQIEEYSTIGSGWKIAEGVLHNLLKYHNEMDRKKIISETLHTVADKNIFCNDEIIIKKIKKV